MNSNRVTEGVGKKIVEALKQQSDVEIMPMDESLEEQNSLDAGIQESSLGANEDLMSTGSNSFEEINENISSFNINNSVSAGDILISDLHVLEPRIVLFLIHNALQPLVRHLLADSVFVVRDENELPLPAIFGIQLHHGMTCCARAGKTIKHNSICYQRYAQQFLNQYNWL